jgi:hypothetical protein
MFRMAKKVWSQSTPFDVQDIHRNDWFKIEGKDAKWTGQKKLVLNTGVPHCTVERRNYSLWHFYVGHERRVTVRREAPNGRTVYLIMVHASPYPSRSSSDDAGAQVPMLVAHGDFLGSSYWFQEVNSAEQRRVARVELSAPAQHSAPAPAPTRVCIGANPRSVCTDTRTVCTGPRQNRRRSGFRSQLPSTWTWRWCCSRRWSSTRVNLRRPGATAQPASRHRETVRWSRHDQTRGGTRSTRCPSTCRRARARSPWAPRPWAAESRRSGTRARRPARRGARARRSAPRNVPGERGSACNSVWHARGSTRRRRRRRASACVCVARACSLRRLASY